MSVVIFPQIPVEIDDATMQEDAPHAQMDMSPGRSPPQLGQPFNSFSNTISNTIQPQWPSSQSEQVQQHQDPMMITQEDGSMNMADAQIIPEIEPDQMHYEEDGTTEVDMGNGEVLEQEYEMMGDAEELNEEVMAADQSFEAEQPLITAFTASDYAEVEHPPAQTLPLQADVAITPTPLLSQTMMTQSQTQPVGAPSIQFDGPISPPAQEKPSVPDNSHSEASRPDAEPLPLPHPQVEEVSQVDHASNAHSEAVQSSEAADPEALPEQPSYSASQGQEFKNDQHLSAEDKDHPTEPASATEAPSNHQDVEYTENPIPPILLSLQIPGSPAPAKLHALFTSPEPSTITSLLSTNVEDEAPTLLLASQPHLFFANLAELLIELREELLTKGFRKEIFDFKELILSARALDLTLSEDNVYAREVSLYDFAVLHQSCSVPGYLHLDLSLQVRFRSRYEEIKRAIAASENQLYQQETEDETRTDTENAHPAEEQGSLSTAPEALKDEEPQDEPLKTHAAVDSVTDNTAIHGPMPTPGSTPRKETKNVTGVQTDSDLGEDVEDEQEYYNEEAQPQPQTADNPSADENQAVEDPLLEWKDEDYPPLPPEEDGDYLNDDEGDYEEPVAGGENKTELESIANPQPESENNGQNVNHELDNTGEHSQESAADGIEHANENDNDLQEHAEIFAAPDDASEDPPAEQIPEPEEPTVIDAQESSNHYIAEHTAEQVGESTVEQGNEEQEIPPLDPVEAQYDGDEDHHDYFDEALVPLLGQDDDVSTLQESEEQEQELGNFEQEETTWNERVGEESELYLDEKNYVDALADEDPVVPPLQAENSLKNPSPARSTSGAKRRYEEYAEEDAAEEDAAVLDTKRARLV